MSFRSQQARSHLCKINGMSFSSHPHWCPGRPVRLDPPTATHPTAVQSVNLYVNSPASEISFPTLEPLLSTLYYFFFLNLISTRVHTIPQYLTYTVSKQVVLRGRFAFFSGMSGTLFCVGEELMSCIKALDFSQILSQTYCKVSNTE